MTYQRISPDSAVSDLRIGGQTRLEFLFGSSQPLLQFQQAFGFNPFAQYTFPYDRDSPASLEQAVSIAPVPFRVGSELGLPELLAGGGGGRVRATGMSVPEAAVNEAYCSKLTKHEIGSAWKLSVMQTVSQAAGMKGTAESQLGSCVPAADSRHHAGPRRLVHYVRHHCPRKVFKEYRQKMMSRKVLSWHFHVHTDDKFPVSGSSHGPPQEKVFSHFSHSGSRRSAMPAVVMLSLHQGGKP